MLVVSFLCNSIYIRLCAESVGGIQWWASESWLLASGAAASAASAVCVATASMGGLASAAAAPVTTAARLVVDVYMAAPTDVAAAPATATAAVGPVSRMNLFGLVWTRMNFAVWTWLELVVVDKRYLWLLNPLMDNIECLLCLFEMHAMIIVIYVKYLYYLGVPYT